jgi:hypothetical protein
MMDIQALPVELLDEKELQGRYKQIDAAVTEAKKLIAQSARERKVHKVQVRLAQPA